MMRILILIIMLLPCSLGMYASAIDSLLSVLDKTIVMRRQYEEEKERYISLIKDELKQGRLTDMERYLIQNRLFAEYNSYISDSALHYINENILIATRLNNRQWINSSILNLKSATTRLYDTEAKIICIVSKKGAQCIECHHKDI